MNKTGKKSHQPISNDQHFEKYKGKIIRNISVKRLDVFGPTVNDTAAQPYLIVQKAGNAVHIKSSRKIIFRNLLFVPGDELVPFTLADNERLLRTLPFIEDARILVKPLKGSDSVDIEVITKDVWPYGVGIDLSSVNSGKFSLTYDNILGYGHELQNNVFWLSGANPYSDMRGYTGLIMFLDRS
ncbi:MAG: hypothetical protein HC906_12545 [Bacteroidales bacterium]|nr:hypothetical protein [Bacteroidales bacterium]